MKYYLDCEFNEFGGELLSMALVRESDGQSCYFVVSDPQEKPGAWVAENVIPILGRARHGGERIGRAHIGAAIRFFLRNDPNPHIIADWPDDISYFCKALITGPGMCVNIEHITFELDRTLDAYPTDLEGAVQHNAWWDAMALRHADMKRKASA